MADLVEREFPTVRDDSEHGYLQTITERLIAALPPTGLHFQVLVVDSPEINGFSVAGGRIYLTRKLIVKAENEDQVAAVLGHEIGHIVAHQIATRTSEEFARLLKIDRVTDRADVYAKFQQLLDAQARSKQGRSDPERDEEEADRIAITLLAAARYNAHASYDFWNKTFFVEGKTGSGLSDFLHTTTVEQKRLRGIQAAIAALPASCGNNEVSRSSEFTAWQARVLANQRRQTPTSSESGRIVALQPVRSRLQRLRFSRDGRWLLAQDESGIFVLTREPLKEQFYIDAPDASAAQWSPDSQEITFLTSVERVERWNVSTQKQVAAYELHLRRPCYDNQLVPDGTILACVQPSADEVSLDFNLIDVASSSVVWSKPHWFSPSYGFALLLYAHATGLVRNALFPRAISSDGQTLVFGFGNDKLAFDLRTRTPVRMSRDLLQNVSDVYAFQGNNRLVSCNRGEPKRSGTYGFPSGDFKPAELHFEAMEAATEDGFVLVPAVNQFEMSLGNLGTGKFMLGSHSDALDAYRDMAALEATNGDIILLEQKDGKGLGRLQLSTSLLPRSTTIALSEDGKYLAFSSRTRGAVWKVDDGSAVFQTIGFTSATWSRQGSLVARFAKRQQTPEQMVELVPLPKNSRVLPYQPGEQERLRAGRLLEFVTTNGSPQVIVHDPLSNAVLWNRSFVKDMPGVTNNADGTDVLLAIPLQTANGKARLSDAALAAQAAALKNKSEGLIVEVLDGGSGAVKSHAVIGLPAVRLNADAFNVVNDQIYVTTPERTYVYSLSTGDMKRQFFGGLVAAENASRRVCLVNRNDEVLVADAQGGEQMHTRLGSPLRFARFVNGGEGLLVLTADQKLHVLEVNRSPSAAVTVSR